MLHIVSIKKKGFLRYVTNSNSNQTTVYFPNHVIITQGNTCAYVNEFTNILNRSRDCHLYTKKKWNRLLCIC